MLSTWKSRVIRNVIYGGYFGAEDHSGFPEVVINIAKVEVACTGYRPCTEQGQEQNCIAVFGHNH
jgi:hypothetical protein